MFVRHCECSIILGLQRLSSAKILFQEDMRSLYESVWCVPEEEEKDLVRIRI